MDPFGLSRQEFLATAVSAAATAGAATPATPAPASITGTVPFAFDRAAFRTILERPYPHRQMVAPSSYDAATVAMSHLRNSLAAYADPHGFAAGPNALHCVAMLYAGRSYAMVLDDAMYAKYPIGLFADEEMRPNDVSARAYWTSLKRNPMAEYLRPLVDDGVSFFVCNNALSGFAVEIARRIAPRGEAPTRERVVAIHDDLAAHFVPGTLLVPAGVAAVNAAQEARFTFLP